MITNDGMLAAASSRLCGYWGRRLRLLLLYHLEQALPAIANGVLGATGDALSNAVPLVANLSHRRDDDCVLGLRGGASRWGSKGAEGAAERQGCVLGLRSELSDGGSYSASR
jgi:hypothetical protein